MGCACISQKESIKTKEVELKYENTSPFYKETYDSVNTIQKIYAEILDEKNLNYQKDKNFKTENEINENSKEEVYVSGPIINMLKRKVENYKKMKKN